MGNVVSSELYGKQTYRKTIGVPGANTANVTRNNSLHCTSKHNKTD